MANPQDQQTTKGAKPGTERARDEQRSDAGPQYHGESWKQAENDEEVTATAADPDRSVAKDAGQGAGESESGGERAGMGRGEKPRKPKSEEK